MDEIKYLLNNGDEFTKGRLHQLINDKFHLIICKEIRVINKIQYISKKEKIKTIKFQKEKLNQLPHDEKVILILNNLKKPINGAFNFNVNNVFHTFEIGRCFQYLLDSDEKKYHHHDLIKYNSDTLILEAYQHKKNILMNKKPIEGTIFPIKHNDCLCCDHQECEYIYDNNRCECGNHKYYIDNEIVGKGLDVELTFNVASY